MGKGKTLLHCSTTKIDGQAVSGIHSGRGENLFSYYLMSLYVIY